MTAVGMTSLQTTALREPDPLQLAEDLAEIVERGQALTGASGLIIALRSYESLVVRTSDGIAPEVGTRIPFPSGVTGLCATTRKPQSCDTDDLVSQLENAFRAVNARSVVAVPIVRNGEAIGVLAALSETRMVFTRTHVAVLMTLADVAGGKLAEWPALWHVARKPAAPAEVFELDVDSLLAETAPSASAPAKPSAAATLQVVPAPALASNPIPQTPTEPVASASVAPKVASASVAPKKVVTVPIASSVPRRSATLRDEPASSPVAADPDVLPAAEDPMRHGSVIAKPAASAAPSIVAKPAEIAAISYAPYRTPKSKTSYVPVFAGCAAVLIVGLGIALYPRHRSVEPAVSTSAAAQPTTAAAQTRLVAVPLKAADVEPPAAAIAPAASAAPAVKSKETAHPVELPKPVAEKPAPTAAPIQLAAGSAKAKPEEAVASPSLGLLATSGKALPDLPVVAAPAAAIPLHKAVTAVLVPAKRLQSVTPQFPSEARRLGETGTVTLLISISAEGKVTDARALSGNPVFVGSSIAAVRQWTYSPARLDGKPVVSTAEVSLHFSAAGR